MTTANVYALVDTWNAGATTFDAIGMDVTVTAHAAASQLLNLKTGGTQRVGVRAPHIALGADVTPFLNLVDVWNTSGAAVGIKLNVTDTASNAASLLIQAQKGGVDQFTVGKTGGIGSAASTNQNIPALFHTLNSTWGIVLPNSVYIGFAAGSSIVAGVTAEGFTSMANASLGFGSVNVGAGAPGSQDVRLFRDATDTLAQRRTTNAQTANHYDTWASTTDYHRLATKTARATLSGVTGASVTATAIIPDGAVVVGVTTKVTTGLGVTGGTTGYNVGDGSDVDRWGAIVGTASGTSSDNTNWTAGTIQAFTVASDIVLTAVGGNFDGTGVIYVSVQYLIGQCD